MSRGKRNKGSMKKKGDNKTGTMAVQRSRVFDETFERRHKKHKSAMHT